VQPPPTSSESVPGQLRVYFCSLSDQQESSTWQWSRAAYVGRRGQGQSPSETARAGPWGCSTRMWKRTCSQGIGVNELWREDPPRRRMRPKPARSEGQRHATAVPHWKRVGREEKTLWRQRGGLETFLQVVFSTGAALAARYRGRAFSSATCAWWGCLVEDQQPVCRQESACIVRWNYPGARGPSTREARLAVLYVVHTTAV